MERTDHCFRPCQHAPSIRKRFQGRAIPREGKAVARDEDELWFPYRSRPHHPKFFSPRGRGAGSEGQARIPTICSLALRNRSSIGSVAWKKAQRQRHAMPHGRRNGNGAKSCCLEGRSQLEPERRSRPLGYVLAFLGEICQNGFGIFARFAPAFTAGRKQGDGSERSRC